MVDYWFYGFWLVYAMFIYTLWTAYLSKLYKRLKYGNRFLHYHIIDTGDYGEHVFTDGENQINGKPRMYVESKVNNGTLFFEFDNVEPLAVKRDLKSYKYFCHTKNFDTVARSDILETFLILNAKQLLILLLGIAILIGVFGIGATWYFTNTMHTDLSSSLEIVKNQTAHPIIIQKGG